MSESMTWLAIYAVGYIAAAAILLKVTKGGEVYKKGKAVWLLTCAGFGLMSWLVVVLAIMRRVVCKMEKGGRK